MNPDNIRSTGIDSVYKHNIRQMNMLPTYVREGRNRESRRHTADAQGVIRE